MDEEDATQLAEEAGKVARRCGWSPTQLIAKLFKAVDDLGTPFDADDVLEKLEETAGLGRYDDPFAGQTFAG